MALTIRTVQRSAWWQELHPYRMVSILWKHRLLIGQLVRREVHGRYRGSLLGTLWMVLLPIVSVIVYSIVFGLILKQRWPGLEGSQALFPLVLWVGLAYFNAFAEVVQRSTSVILAQPNLVKKVVFPLETLPVMVVGASLVPLVISLFVVCLGVGVLQGMMPDLVVIVSALAMFLIWLQGLSWLLAGVGTFLRDLGPMVQAVCPLVLFMTPLLYSIEVIPQPYREWFLVNPLCVIVEMTRAGMLHGALPAWWAMVGCLISSVAAWLIGSLIFARLRPEMADVV